MAPKITPPVAHAAYAEAAARLRTAPVPAPGATPAPSFAALLAESVGDAVAANRHGEAAAMRALAGPASLQEVVEAVNSAELSLRTVVAMRDRIIAAYQEIMRMPI